MLYGGSPEPPFQPQSDADWELVARAHTRESAAVHGLDEGPLHLCDGGIKFLPLAMGHAGTNKMAARFHQQAGGYEVVDGFVNVLMDLQGRMLMLQTTASPFLHELRLDVRIQ